MKTLTIKTVDKPMFSNCLPGKSYKVKKETGGFVVKSKRFGLFIDSRDVA